MAITGQAPAAPGYADDPRQPGAVETTVDGVAAALVAGGGDQAARLVQREVDRRRFLQRTAVDGDACARRDRTLRVADDAPVHCDPAVGDPARGDAARARAAARKRARQAVPGSAALTQTARLPKLQGPPAPRRR